jgi:putative transposase
LPKAKRSGRGIAIEDMNGIRERVKAGHKQRAVLHSWAFSQLRLFLEYKAKLAAVQLVTVDPRNTSRTCSACGHCAKENRKSQGKFRCRSCSHEAHADINAAVNIGRAACKPAALSELCEGSHGLVKNRRLRRRSFTP